MAEPVVIVKKVKKKGHGGHHGGSWKVAYADFVTALMAFFLLMWLVTAKKASDKVGLETYFKEYDITKGSEAVRKTIREKIGQYEAAQAAAGNKSLVDLPQKPDAVLFTEESTRQIVGEWKTQIEGRLAEFSNQVLVDLSPDGAVMIQMVDKLGVPLFPTGGTELTDTARSILAVIWEKIRLENVKVAIEGHTDAYQYSRDGKTNWELSTERASAARKELERLGLPAYRLLRVTGLADTKPYSEDPYSPMNRRISLLLYYYTAPAQAPEIVPKT